MIALPILNSDSPKRKQAKRKRVVRPRASTDTHKSTSSAESSSSYDSLEIKIRMDRAFWRRCLRDAPISIAQFTKELGLKGYPTFANRYVAELGLEISAAATALEDLSGRELLDCACDGEYLMEEVELLVGIFGKRIWGRDVHVRSHLCRELVFERERDLKLLKQRLRQWIFLEAFAKLRNDRADKSTEAIAKEADKTCTLPRRKSTAPTPSKGEERFPLDKPWDERTWRLISHRSSVNIDDVLCALGLISPDSVRKGPKVFVDPDLKALERRISAIAKDVWERLGDDGIVAAAANSSYLNTEIDLLLYDLGPEVWGMQLQPPRRLVLEEDDDRQLIWLHLHQWIFLKVCNLKRCAEAERRNKTIKYTAGESAVELQGHSGIVSLLRQYFLTTNDRPVPDERKLLSQLSAEWAAESTHYQSVFPSDFHPFLAAFHEWIEWRSAVVRVREYLESGALPPQPSKAETQCKALLDDLRERRIEFWQAVRAGQGADVEQMTVPDVLCEVVTKILWPDGDGMGDEG